MATTPPSVAFYVSAMLDGQKKLEANLSCSVIWNGQQVVCAGGPEYLEQVLSEGGFEFRNHIKIMVRTSLFTGGSLPQVKQTVQFVASAGGTPRTYKIDSILNYYDQLYQLICVDPRKGA